ncbi:MAG: hypothetical protein ACYS1A_08690 [Planctomycetota bacterium]|jgi:hypothetical protein
MPLIAASGNNSYDHFSIRQTQYAVVVLPSIFKIHLPITKTMRYLFCRVLHEFRKLTRSFCISPADFHFTGMHAELFSSMKVNMFTFTYRIIVLFLVKISEPG